MDAISGIAFDDTFASYRLVELSGDGYGFRQFNHEFSPLFDLCSEAFSDKEYTEGNNKNQ